jgi:hypothetical protein
MVTYALVLPSVPLDVVHVQAPVQARKHQLEYLTPSDDILSNEKFGGLG